MAPTNVTASINSGGNSINLVIEDITAVGAAVAAAAGNIGAAQLIALIGKLVNKAVEGFDHGATVVINEDSIAALLRNVPLDSPAEVPPPGASGK